MSQKRQSLHVVALVLFMIGVFAAIRIVGTDRLRLFVDGAGVLAPIVYIVLRALSGFVPFASGPIQLTSGVLFGFWSATLYTLVASTIGYSISFLIARHYGRAMVERLVGEGMSQVDTLLERLDSALALATVRLVFAFTFDIVAYAAGLSRLRYPVFALVTFILGFPPTAAAVFAGLVAAGDVQIGWLP